MWCFLLLNRDYGSYELTSLDISRRGGEGSTKISKFQSRCTQKFYLLFCYSNNIVLLLYYYYIIILLLYYYYYIIIILLYILFDADCHLVPE